MARRNIRKMARRVGKRRRSGFLLAKKANAPNKLTGLALAVLVYDAFISTKSSDDHDETAPN